MTILFSRTKYYYVWGGGDYEDASGAKLVILIIVIIFRVVKFTCSYCIHKIKFDGTYYADTDPVLIVPYSEFGLDVTFGNFESNKLVMYR